jgi:hypothetical protein
MMVCWSTTALGADAIGGVAWAPDPMKSIAPDAATVQKIDRIVLSDRNEERNLLVSYQRK